MNRRVLIIVGVVVGVLLLVCFACSALVITTASSPSFQATSTAQALARATQSTNTPSVQTKATAPPASLPLPTLIPTSLPATPTSVPPTQTSTPVPVKVSAKQTVNVRQGPGTQFAAVGKLQPSTTVVASGKSEDGQWLQIPIPDATNPGWVSVSVVSVTGATDSLRVAIVVATSTATRSVTVSSKSSSQANDFTSAEMTYMLAMAKVSDDYALAIGGVVSLLDGVKKNSSLMIDPQWKSDMALVLAWVSKLSRDIKSTNPPTRFVSIHGDMLEISGHMDKFVTYMAQGIDEINNDKLVKAGNEIDSITVIMGRVTTKLNNFTQAGKTLPTVTSTRKIPTASPLPPSPIAKNVATNLQGKWEMTYVGEFRDKTVYFYDTGKTAFGVWATVQFRIKNLQSGSDRIGNSFSFIAIDQNGKIYKEIFDGTLNAAWQYCGCDSHVDELGPGQETVIVLSFDVPENTQSLAIAPTTGMFSTTPLATPRFVITNFAQIPAWKSKK